jgi:SET domain-containing protein
MPRRTPVQAPPPSKPLKSIERRRSKISGWGVYTRESITKNSRIVQYAGEKITHRQSWPREEAQLAQGHIWCFKVNNRWVRDAAVGGNIARFLNHACKPNCYTHVIGDVIWIRAARNIRRGEELTYDYYTEGAASIPCRCRPDCKVTL